MRNTLLALLAAVCISASSGCCGYHWWGHKGGCDSCNSGCGCDQGCGYCGANCGACGPGGCPDGSCGGGGCAEGGCGGGCGCGCLGHNADNRAMVAQQLGGPAGPPAAQVTYPYYTIRGPRDYFAKNPPSIGP